MERPIIFNDAMSLAVVELRKTVTRRPLVINGAPARGAWWDHAGFKPVAREGYVRWEHSDGSIVTGYARDLAPCPRVPFGVPGDKLWVREAWRVSEATIGLCEYRCDGGTAEPTIDPAYQCEATLERWQSKTRGGKWAPSIHMPRWASRTVLDVLDVRVERLQDMTEEDALAEGFDPIPAHGSWVLAPRHEGGHWSARPAFAATWDAIYPAMPWASNPWVWVVQFKREGVV